MNTLVLKLYVKFQDLMSREEGQDLVEYALVAAIIALGAVATMTSLQTEINTVYTDITSALTTAVA
jgi:pilus assembly protein Flp/PilA